MGTGGYSQHFRYAVVSTVFSAFAVEHAITELIWVECFLKTPAPHRQKTMQLAQKLLNIPDKLEFLQNSTQLSKELLNALRELFDRRNRLVHLRSKDVFSHDSGVIDFEGAQALLQQGRGRELDSAIESALQGKPDALQTLIDEVGGVRTSLTLPGISSDVIDEAEENFGIAKRALKALRKEWNTPKARCIP